MTKEHGLSAATQPGRVEAAARFIMFRVKEGAVPGAWTIIDGTNQDLGNGTLTFDLAGEEEVRGFTFQMPAENVTWTFGPNVERVGVQMPGSPERLHGWRESRDGMAADFMFSETAQTFIVTLVTLDAGRVETGVALQAFSMVNGLKRPDTEAR